MAAHICKHATWAQISSCSSATLLEAFVGLVPAFEGGCTLPNTVVLLRVVIRLWVVRKPAAAGSRQSCQRKPCSSTGCQPRPRMNDWLRYSRKSVRLNNASWWDKKVSFVGACPRKNFASKRKIKLVLHRFPANLYHCEQDCWLLFRHCKLDADKCRGFGYVTYSMAEDSQRAMKEIKDYDGQRISVSVAKKKQQDQKKKTGERKALLTSMYFFVSRYW